MLSTPRTKSMIGSPIWRLTRTDVSMHYVHDVALVATVTWLGGGGSIAGGGALAMSHAAVSIHLLSQHIRGTPLRSEQSSLRKVN